jgi:hypothetical protein
VDVDGRQAAGREEARRQDAGVALQDAANFVRCSMPTRARSGWSRAKASA